MQPIGSKALRDAYHDRLRSSHDYTLDVDVLTMEERHVGSAHLTSGQVNLQKDGTAVRRTGTFTFYDPDHRLNLDPDSIFEAGLFAHRMVRVRHTLNVPGFGEVEVTPFVGPIATLARDGDEVTVECQDKTALAIRGTRPKTVRKGKNAVDAIHDILYDCTGERHFRLPSGTRHRLPKSYNVGWKDEASPWRVCQKIAGLLDMQLIYSCDGYVTLREFPTEPVFTFDAARALTALPTNSQDYTNVVNHVRVVGGKKKVAAGVSAPSSWALSAQKLGRNGAPRWLPEVIEDSGIKRDVVAKARAARELNKHLSMSNQISWTGVPVFHLDVGDIIRIRTEDDEATLKFDTGSIPLMPDGEMTGGRMRTVMRRRVKVPRFKHRSGKHHRGHHG